MHDLDVRVPSCGSGRRVEHRPPRHSRNETIARSKRFGGTASTRSMRAACSGWRRAAKRNSEWMAASRALRVLRAAGHHGPPAEGAHILFRSASKWARKAAMRAAEHRLETESGHRGHRRRSAQGGIGQFEEGVAPTPAAAMEALSKLDQLTQRPRSRRPFRHDR